MSPRAKLHRPILQGLGGGGGGVEDSFSRILGSWEEEEEEEEGKDWFLYFPSSSSSSSIRRRNQSSLVCRPVRRRIHVRRRRIGISPPLVSRLLTNLLTKPTTPAF
jgi:hypothetical protein